MPLPEEADSLLLSRLPALCRPFAAEADAGFAAPPLTDVVNAALPEAMEAEPAELPAVGFPR